MRKSKPSKNFAGTLGLFNHIEFVCHKKPSSTLAVIREFEVIDFFYDVHKELKRIFNAFYLIELVNECVPEQDVQPQLFFLLKLLLTALASNKQPDILRFFFQCALLHELGMAPNFHTCIQCEVPLKNIDGIFSIARSGILCKNCKNQTGGAGIHLHKTSIHFLQYLETATLGDIGDRNLLPSVVTELNVLYRFYFRSIIGKEFRMTRYLQK